MSRYHPATPRVPTQLLSSNPITLETAHHHLQSYLLSTTSSQPWSHSHDAGTTASLKKLELALRGIHGPAANSHFIPNSGDNSNNNNNNNQQELLDLEDTFSKPDTDEGGESERQRVYETVEDLEVAEEIRDEDEGMVMRELQSVERVEEGQEDVEMLAQEEDGEDRAAGKAGAVVDKEERKRLKKLRIKEEKRRKEAERAGARE